MWHDRTRQMMRRPRCERDRRGHNPPQEGEAMTSSSSSTERPIDSIKIGKRHRRELRESRFSFRQHRARRWPFAPHRHQTGRAACCGRAAVAGLSGTRLENDFGARAGRENIVRAEAAENFERQDFTPSEAVAIKRTLEPEMKAEAERRMRSGKPLGNFPRVAAPLTKRAPYRLQPPHARQGRGHRRGRRS